MSKFTQLESGLYIIPDNKLLFYAKVGLTRGGIIKLPIVKIGKLKIVKDDDLKAFLAKVKIEMPEVEKIFLDYGHYGDVRNLSKEFSFSYEAMLKWFKNGLTTLDRRTVKPFHFTVGRYRISSVEIIRNFMSLHDDIIGLSGPRYQWACFKWVHGVAYQVSDKMTKAEAISMALALNDKNDAYYEAMRCKDLGCQVD